MRRVANFIAFGILIASCNSETKTVTPSGNDGARFHYNTHDISFSTDSNYRIIQSIDKQNPHITILRPDKDTFVVTTSSYPLLVDPFKKVLDPASGERKDYLKKLENNHFLTWDEEVVVVYFSEERLKEKMSSMTIRIEDLGDRYFWGRMPLKGKEGYIDIVIESKNVKEKTKVKLWGFTKKCSGDEEIFKLAKTVQI